MNNIMKAIFDTNKKYLAQKLLCTSLLNML